MSYWDGQTIHQIRNGYNRLGGHFSLYDGTLAWIGQDRSDRGYYVWYWNGAFDTGGQPNIEKISPVAMVVGSDGGDTSSLSLYDGQIAWTSSDGNDYEIYLWDGTYHDGLPNITQISDNDDQDRAPSIADGMIAWRGGPSRFRQVVRYWDGSGVQTLGGSNVAGAPYSVSTSNGAIAWRGLYGFTINYWDGTFNGGIPSIVTVAHGSVSNPSLHKGKISYYKRDPARPQGEDSAVFYWNGADTIQLSEWYGLRAPVAPATSGSGVAYMGVNATTDLQEIRFVTSTGLCL
ncbi:MAG: hypothetical protein KZQ76_07285 [Candidatus Thiodiazotropha sp. (ex Epidulcina cf. delphinae)]|nr:hypothetical protein [Candidatus Thiodiazotropha sp. (ex Epidulcina cf. delphinae)]